MAIDDRVTALEVRVDNLEASTADIKVLSSSMVELTTEIKHMNKTINKVDARVEQIENGPRDTIKTIKNCIITALVSGAVTAILTALVMGA